MEALSNSALQIKSLSDRSSGIWSSKTSYKHCALLRIPLNSNKTPSLRRTARVSDPAREVSNDGGAAGDDISLDKDNGVLRLVTQETYSLPQDNSDHQQSTASDINFTPRLMGTNGATSGGGTRAGLFRTPISGGVQSATSTHGLPRPALAVRNLMEQARFAQLCTVMSRKHHRTEGYPFGSLVDFAPDPMGHPIFLFSPLSMHTMNLMSNPKCSLVVQTPGWSGLSNARVTIIGDVYRLPNDQQEWAHKQYMEKHPHVSSRQWGNLCYFRMQNIRDIYFIGGFGTVAWIDVKEYENLKPDKIAVDGSEQNLKELNATFSKPLKELLSKVAEVDDVVIISMDSRGVDIRVRQGAQFKIQRISFEGQNRAEMLEEAKQELWRVMDGSKAST